VWTLTAAFTYDNFNINFQTSQPTAERESTFVSATLATVIPLFDVKNLAVLKCSNELWKLDPGNPSPLTVPLKLKPDNIKLLRELQGDDNKKQVGERLSPWNKQFAWHIRNILVHHREFFSGLAENLSTPDEI
jgi:hypothetical protein